MAEQQRTYAEQLRDPRWQQMRLRVLERDRWTCDCGDSTTTLHVHQRQTLQRELDPSDSAG